MVAAPGEGDGAFELGGGQGLGLDVCVCEQARVLRHFRDEGVADAIGHHLDQGHQTAALKGVGAGFALSLAEREGLVVEAVAFLE